VKISFGGLEVGLLPNSRGGLGIRRLRSHNIALLRKCGDLGWRGTVCGGR